ncbi:hypothetical protein OG21DRAFT_1187521 [Imleria badia]|nr:hypothetical protein OG21DRAFT_1187521 [Imleria badia]
MLRYVMCRKPFEGGSSDCGVLPRHKAMYALTLNGSMEVPSKESFSSPCCNVHCELIRGPREELWRCQCGPVFRWTALSSDHQQARSNFSNMPRKNKHGTERYPRGSPTIGSLNFSRLLSIPIQPVKSQLPISTPPYHDERSVLLSADIRSVPIPTISDNEVLLKVTCCLFHPRIACYPYQSPTVICGTDSHVHEGEFIAKFPPMPGHEVIGTIATVGKDVIEFRVATL